MSEDYEEEQDESLRQCEDSCSHYDGLNGCCWVATNYRLCTDVEEFDFCLYSFSDAPYGDFKVKRSGEP